jgi:hypothetical protein
MENTRLIELRGVYAKELATGRYLTAEHVCWRALEICGYCGSRRKFSYWLTTARLQVGMKAEEEPLWQWACLLADIYYGLGRYTEAEPIYARLAVMWMSSTPDLMGAKTHSVLPDLLRKLAGAEAFIGKNRRAGKHWKLAKQLAGKSKRVPAVFLLRSLEFGRMPITSTIVRGPISSKLFSRWESVTNHRRFWRNR